ncbi:MAG TPA: fructose 1,6-bisphosphatase, partial [Flavobacteriaceae bacterium]|nr:fructose 1,6-bisphosphatase [Flavobacteriaceae bacterium]
LFDLSRMVFADHIADDAERNLLKRLVIGLGFPTEDVNEIIEKSFIEIQKGSSEEDFVTSFK